MPLLGGYPQVSEPADTSAYTKQVEVSLAVQRSLSFSSMFLSAAPVITVTARAAAVDSGYFCVIAKEDTNTPGIIIQGSAYVNMGCGMISNSPSASVSVDVIGSGHNVTAEPVAGVGGVPQINGVTNEQSYHLSQPDPYENLHSTDIPTHGAVQGFNIAARTVGGTGSPAATTISIRVQRHTQLAPGVYYLNNATMRHAGQRRRLPVPG